MDAIKNLRKSKHWSQQMLAEKAMVSQNTIHNYESGKRCPRIPELQKIASALDCSVADLLKE